MSLSPMFPAGFAELVDNSFKIRQEIETNGGVVTYTPYVPTDLEKDGTKELLDGWKEEMGTCQSCWTLRSLSGACEC